MAKRYIVTIDLGGTNLKVALLDLGCKIIDKKVLSTKNSAGKEGLISVIINSIAKIIKSNNLKRADVLGAGLGLPGPIDTKRGIVHFFPNIPGWQEVNLKAILEKKLKLSVYMDNDTNLMALAEHKLGAAKGFKNALCLTLGTGVGGGVIIEDKLYRGSNFSAGEIGHIPINEKGPRCNCGGIACLESYIGNNRILKEARKAFGRRITLEEVTRLASHGNKKALAIWSEVGRHLGNVLIGVVNLLNPDVIVIGGGVANAGMVLFDKVREVILNRAMSVQAQHVKVFKAKLGNDAGLIGAAILVKQEALKQ